MNGAVTGQTAGIYVGVIVIAYLVLLLFGIAYNAVIGWMERTRRIEGFVSLTVALGVGVTLAGITIPLFILSMILPEMALPAWGWGVITLGAFAASGTPMMVGSVGRYWKERSRAVKAMIEEVRGGNEA